LITQGASGRLAALKSVQKTLQSVAKAEKQKSRRCELPKTGISIAKGVEDSELQKVAKLAAKAL
jgi:hypothetical protein